MRVRMILDSPRAISLAWNVHQTESGVSGRGHGARFRLIATTAPRTLGLVLLGAHADSSVHVYLYFCQTVFVPRSLYRQDLPLRRKKARYKLEDNLR